MDKEVKKFLIDVKKSFSDVKILLFGSRAKGTARKDSDYDFIVISRKFKNIPYVDRAYEVRKNTNANIVADIICYAPGEVNRIAKNSIFLKDALKYAIPM